MEKPLLQGFVDSLKSKTCFQEHRDFFRGVFYEPISGKETLNKVVIVGSSAETSMSVA